MSRVTNRETNSGIPDEFHLLSRIIEAGSALVVLLDGDGRIRFVNRRFEAVSGFDRTEVLGLDWFEMCLPQRHCNRISDLFESATNGARKPGNISPILTRDCREVPIEWYDEILIDGDPRAKRLLVIGQDVTGRHRILETAGNGTPASG